MELDEELAFGLKVIRYHTLEACLDAILKACTEIDAVRDPVRMAAMIGRIGEEAPHILGDGDDNELAEVVKMLDTDKGRKMMKEAVTMQLMGARLATWSVLDCTSRWTDSEQFHRDMREARHDCVTPDEIRARFEERMDEWMKLDCPELMMAARAHKAMKRLKDTRFMHFGDLDCWAVGSILLDGD